MQNINIIEMPVKEWHYALQGIGKVVSRKSRLPVLDYLKIRRDPNGQVMLAGTDLDSLVIYRAKSAQAGPEADFLVPMEALEKAVKSSEGKVGLISDGQKQVKIQTYLAGQLVEQQVEVAAKEEWPEVPKIEADGFKVSGEFLVTLRQALECASEDPARLVLQSAYLDVSDPQAHYLVAASGRLMFSANSFAFDLKAPLIIPNRKFLNWKELADTEAILTAQMLASDKATVEWIQLQTSRWIFITKGIEESFPNWRQIVPTEGFKAKIRLSYGTMKILQDVAPKLPGSDESNQPIMLLVKDRCFHLAGQQKNGGGVTTIPIATAAVEGEAVRVGLNRLHLLKALRFGLNEIRIVDEASPVLFSNAAGKRLVAAPIRMS